MSGFYGSGAKEIRGCATPFVDLALLRSPYSVDAGARYLVFFFSFAYPVLNPSIFKFNISVTPARQPQDGYSHSIEVTGS